jgi:hypothetical protein
MQTTWAISSVWPNRPTIFGKHAGNACANARAAPGNKRALPSQFQVHGDLSKIKPACNLTVPPAYRRRHC